MLTVLSLLPLLTAGQAFGSVTLTVNNRTDFAFGPELCTTSLGGRWVPLLKGSPCSSMSLWVTSGECGEKFAEGDLVLPEVTAASLLDSINNVAPANIVPIPVSELPRFAESEASGGMGCGVLGVEHTYKFCSAVSMALDVACVSPTVVTGTPATLRYDTKPPAVPEIGKVEGLDESLSVSFKVVDADTSTVVVQLRGPFDVDFHDATTVSADSSTALIEQLKNDVNYSVRVFGVDAVGNASAPGEEVAAHPNATIGFWGACREAGCGTGAAGCQATGGAIALAALALLVLARLRRS